MQLVDREREEDKERGIERERHRLSLNFSLSFYLHLKCSKLLAIGKTNQLNKCRQGQVEGLLQIHLKIISVWLLPLFCQLYEI